MNQKSKWRAIRRKKSGAVVGYIQVFYSPGLRDWVTIPGVSRWRDAG